MMLFKAPQEYWKLTVLHFAPSWHAINMGTGAVSLLFHNFPFTTGSRIMNYFGLSFFILNIILFIIFTTAGIIRYTTYRNAWRLMFNDPVLSLFLGTFPMGFATLLMAAVSIVYQYFGFGGAGFIYAVWGLWWLDIVVSILVCFVQLHVMFTHHDHNFNEMTSVWLLPIVTLVVASSAGGLIADALVAIDVRKSVYTSVVCLVLVVIGISWALMVLTIYIQRLFLHHLPHGILIFSAFLPLGPLGQAGYSFLLIGQLARRILPINDSMTILSDPIAPHVIELVCFCISMVLWSFGTSWVALAVLAILHNWRRGGLKFKSTFWGMVFPNGVYANLTIQLGVLLDAEFFRVWGSIYALFTLGLWSFAAFCTVANICNGAPFCVASLEEEVEVTEVVESRDKSGPYSLP